MLRSLRRIFLLESRFRGRPPLSPMPLHGILAVPQRRLREMSHLRRRLGLDFRKLRRSADFA
ncbi:hypothetical protein AV944_06935 [Sphingomonas sp. LK11]|nr:hypothetical protein AV944_06935 [Sphingomonas sp. LK11]